jgi:hypothetical protein
MKETINHSRPNSAKLKWPLESDDSLWFLAVWPAERRARERFEQ